MLVNFSTITLALKQGFYLRIQSQSSGVVLYTLPGISAITKKNGKQGFKSKAMEQSLWLIIKIKIALDFIYFSYSSTSSLTGDFSRTTEGFFEKSLRQVTGIIPCLFAAKASL